MEPEAVLRQLKDLAEKMDITVKERVLKKRPVHVKSGMCKVHGRPYLILDKKLPVRSKIDLLVDAIWPMACDDIYVVPFVRDLLKNAAEKNRAKSNTPPNQSSRP